MKRNKGVAQAIFGIDGCVPQDDFMCTVNESKGV